MVLSRDISVSLILTPILFSFDGGVSEAETRHDCVSLYQNKIIMLPLITQIFIHFSF